MDGLIFGELICNKYLAGKILVTGYFVKLSMALCTALCFEFSVQAMVRGYHVYQNEWDAVIGEVLQLVTCTSHTQWLL